MQSQVGEIFTTDSHLNASIDQSINYSIEAKLPLKTE